MADKPQNYGSFGYKVFDPRIKAILQERSLLDNTIQVAMPFVKATATIQIPEYLGADNNFGFTLGVHAIADDVRFEDMYSERDGSEYPLIGYTYINKGNNIGGNKKVYCKPPSGPVQGINTYLDQGLSPIMIPESSRGIFTRIPPPGITQATIGRNKNGLLVSAQLQISVPSIMQLEALHRTFLIPGIGMIVEWGQQFAPENVNNKDGNFGEIGLNANTFDKMFPWYRPDEALALLDRLGQRKVGIQEILEDYVYPTQGQYMWMFGRVANFSVKGTSDGAFDVTVKVVGPSEDSWAYTTKNTITTGRESTGTYCVGKINSIKEYFENRDNDGFELLLTEVYNNKNHPWNSHVMKFQNGKETTDPGFLQLAKEGFQKFVKWLSNSDNRNMDIESFEDVPDAYYMTWRFFVNMVLNGGVSPGGQEEPVVGSLLRAFKDNLSPEQFEKITLLRPYTTTNGDVATTSVLLDPYENRVGANYYLRSIDVTSLVLRNPFEPGKDIARKPTDKMKKIWQAYDLQTEPTLGFDADKRVRDTGKFLEPAISNPTFELIEEPNQSELPSTPQSPGSRVGAGDWTPNSGASVTPTTTIQDQDFAHLSSGVWLNHYTIIEAMASAETFLQGITNLLQRMNSATNNYWALSLDAVEPNGEDNHTYTVIDTNYRPNSKEAVDMAINGTDGRLYTFNKYSRNTTDGKLIGSELLEANIDLSLPKRLFAQIAAGGLLRPEDRGNRGQQLSSLVSEPNETQRYMYSLVTLSSKLPDNKSTDLTIGTYQDKTNGICADINDWQYGNPGIIQRNKENLKEQALKLTGDQIEADLKKAEAALDNEWCQECFRCKQPSSLSGVSGAVNEFGERADTYARNLANFTGLGESGTNWSQPLGNIVYEKGFNDLTPPQQEQMLDAITKQEGGPGDINYRNNNPGAIVLGKIGNELQITTTLTSLAGFDVTRGDQANGNVYAKFPSMAIGRNAMRSLLSGGSYTGRSAAQQVAKWLGAESGNTPVQFSTPSPTTQSTSPEEVVVSQYGECVENTLPVLKKTRSGKLAIVTDTTGNVMKDPPKDTAELVAMKFSDSGVLSGNDVVLLSDQVWEQCAKCYTDKATQEALQAALSSAGGLRGNEIEKLQTEHRNLSQLFKYREYKPSYMMTTIRGLSNDSNSNAFGTAPGSLSLSADLTLPGINGLRVGQLFWIDRIPTFYKIFGAFQILSIEDTIDVNGWRTNIHSRFNYLGKEWRNEVIKLLQNQGIDI